MAFLRRDVIEAMSDKELDKYMKHLEYFHKNYIRNVIQYKKKLKEVRLIRTMREKPWRIA